MNSFTSILTDEFLNHVVNNKIDDNYSLYWNHWHDKVDDRIDKITSSNKILGRCNYLSLLDGYKNIDLDSVLDWNNKHSNYFELPAVHPYTTKVKFNNSLHYSIEYFNYFDSFPNKQNFILPIFGNSIGDIRKWMKYTKKYKFGGYSIEFGTEYFSLLLFIIATLESNESLNSTSYIHLYGINSPHRLLVAAVVGAILKKYRNITILVSFDYNRRWVINNEMILSDSLMLNDFNTIEVIDFVDTFPEIENNIPENIDFGTILYTYNIQMVNSIVAKYFWLSLLNSQGKIKYSLLDTVYEPINNILKSRNPLKTYTQYARTD